MHYVLIGFLWFSLLIYLIMGGADFGTGILELFSAKDNRPLLRRTSYQAIGPIWEANHMWLIIAVVVLFVGFPTIYSTVSIYLHIPLLIMLMGIIARGTAFTFRNYDAVMDRMQGVYNKIYVYSSFITPLFLGIIAGSVVSGKIDIHTTDFMTAYIYDWLDPFACSVGLFTTSLCSFLAAIYLIGEIKNPSTNRRYKRMAAITNMAMLIFMIIIFVTAFKEKIPLTQWLFGNTLSLFCVGLASICFVFVWTNIYNDKVASMRFFASALVTLLLIAVTYSHYPDLVLLKDHATLSLMKHQAPESTVHILATTLLIGSLFILPALFYLVYSFGRKEKVPH
jgi:cytochrome d ubiquinol oxidase subunit II